MKLAPLAFALFLFTGCGAAPDKVVTNEVVDVGCGTCIYKRTGGVGCYWAIELEGELVEGVGVVALVDLVGDLVFVDRGEPGNRLGSLGLGHLLQRGRCADRRQDAEDRDDQDQLQQGEASRVRDREAGRIWSVSARPASG